MSNPERLTSKDLEVGGQYLHVNRLFIRQIDAIDGDTVIYHDQYGLMRWPNQSVERTGMSRFAGGQFQGPKRLIPVAHLARSRHEEENRLVDCDLPAGLTY